MLAAESTRTQLTALDIPYVTAQEAYRLMQTEFERFLSLIETLDPQDWEKPTACTAWNVRDILAHQAGGYSAGTGYREALRQLIVAPKKSNLMEDNINTLQLAERAGKTPAELIAELKQVTPLAIQKWAYAFRLFKLLGLPHPVPGWLSIRHLCWVIHSRDTWMHRLDISRATHKTFVQTAEHDGRIAELVMRDAAKQLSRKLGGKALLFELTGIAGGVWKVGAGQPAASVQMDVLDFNIFASGRYSYEQARHKATISGDVAFAEAALRDLLVLY